MSVIQCLQLDPTTASCAYVVDSNMCIVRGFSRTGRRLLTICDATYTSLDPTCRDTLVSEALPNTRTACQANFDSSRATLELLGLERQLPACSFCNLTDAIEATRSNPLAVMRMGLSKAMQRITDTDASTLVAVHQVAQNDRRACSSNESACKFFHLLGSTSFLSWCSSVRHFSPRGGTTELEAEPKLKIPRKITTQLLLKTQNSIMSAAKWKSTNPKAYICECYGHEKTCFRILHNLC